jgi:hypothetical protein
MNSEALNLYELDAQSHYQTSPMLRSTVQPMPLSRYHEKITVCLFCTQKLQYLQSSWLLRYQATEYEPFYSMQICPYVATHPDKTTRSCSSCVGQD